MTITAFVAASSPGLSRIMSSVCEDVCHPQGITIVALADDRRLMEELRAARPSLVFLHAILIESAEGNLIATIKEDPALVNPMVVVCAQRSEWAEIADRLGADAFLPLPFSTEQCGSVLRKLIDAPRKVLIVARPGDALAAMYAKLAAGGQRVSLAKSAEEGQRLAEQSFPDVILCDWDLPDLSGLDFCQRIKRARATSSIPVLMLARDAQLETIEQCFECGAHDILLPPFDPEDIRVRVATVVASPSTRRGEKVLLIDDSLLVRHVVTRMVRQIGMIAIAAPNAIEGLEVARRERPDLVICDLDMPAMDGAELCRRLRAEDATRSVPVILISNSVPPHIRNQAEELGIAAFLDKPFKSHELRDVVLAVLGTE
jgi:CheY-like chemotaxis protein